MRHELALQTPAIHIDPSQLYDPRPLQARERKLLKLFLAKPLGRIIRYRDFYDSDISLATLALDAMVLRRALKQHGMTIKSHRKQGYALVVLETQKPQSTT